MLKVILFLSLIFTAAPVMANNSRDENKQQNFLKRTFTFSIDTTKKVASKLKDLVSDKPLTGERLRKRFFSLLRAGDVEGVKFILNNARYKNEDGSQGDLATAAMLGLKDDNQNTPLHIAAQYGHLNMAKFLIQTSGNQTPTYMKAKGPHDMIPAHIAAMRGRAKMMNVFLENMDNDALQMTDRFGWNIWHHAVRSSSLDVVRLLIDEEKGGSEGDRRKIMRDLSIGADKYDKLPLHWAAAEGQVKIIQHIFSQGAARTGDKGERLPLHYAVWNQHTQAVDYLLTKTLPYDDGDVVDAWTDRAGVTPLHWAVQNKNLAIFDRLMLRLQQYRHNARGIVNAQNANTDETALHIAVKQNNLAMVKKLIVSKANIALKNKQGETPVYLASYYGRLNMLKAMLGKNKDKWDANQSPGQHSKNMGDEALSPLDAAAGNGYSKVVNWWLLKD